MKNIEELKQISLVDYLQRLGYQPLLRKHNAYWYCSPLRLEHTPSFKVNLERNQWYDFALGKGGDLIDLVCAMRGVARAKP